MGKENGRGKSRRRNISQARKFLNREGKKLCSAALCVSLLFGSVLNTTVAANKDTDDDGYEFELSRASLYQALQDAVLNGDTVDEDMEFRGSAAEEYSEMFAPSGSLYELKPEIEDNDGKVQLRVFAKLDQDIDLDSEYEAAGTEEIMFLLTNRSDEAQKAVIYMDDKYTEEIKVAPGKAIAVQEDETSQGPAGGGAGNGGGSSSGGSAAGGETPADTETTGPADEGGQAPDNGGAPTESQPEETTGTEDKDDATTPDGATDPAEGDDNVTDGNEETGDSADDKTDDSATSDNDNSTSVEDGNNENSGNGGDTENTENTGDPNTDSDNAGNENQSGGQTGAGEGGSENTGNTENGGGSTDDSDGGNSTTGGDSTASNGGSGSSGGDSSSDSSDSGNDGSDSGTTTAAISFHKASWVAAPVATDSDMPVATDSDLATNSDLEKLIDGELYEAVRLRENGAVAFVTTLDDLGVMDGWGPIVFGQKFEADCGNFHVRAIARKGALDNAYMEVTSIDPETNPEEYEKAAQSLAEAGKQYEGMAALDITFRDKDTGEEVEPWSDSENPADWPVYVTIEFLENALPEDINLDTVEVQHLKETKVEGSQEEVQIDVEEVADAGGNTDGIVAPANLVDTELVEVSAKAEAVAVFSVESFSTFTITWDIAGELSKFNVAVHYVNSLGDPIDSTQEDIAIKGGTTINFAEYASKAANTSLKYSGAYYGGLDGNEIDAMTAAVEYGIFDIPSYSLEFKKGNQVIKTLTAGFGTTTANVYLKFETDSVVDPPEVDERKLRKSKTVTLNEADGTYDLDLSISGAVGTITNKAQLDILMILDRSSSMTEEMGTSTKLQAVKNAANGLIDSISQNESIVARYNIVTFNELDEIGTGVVQNWTFDANQTKQTITDLNIPPRHGYYSTWGTNYQEGIRQGKEQLKDARDGAQTIVIFLSDGIPTFRNTTDQWGDLSQTGTGYSDDYKYNINAAVGEIRGMSCSAFYAIGAGDDFSNPDKQASKNLNMLCQNVNADITSWHSATETDELEKVFDDIAAESTSILCDSVVVSDTLSENVNAVLNSKGVPEKLILTVSGKDDKGDPKTYGGTSNIVSLPKTNQNAATTLTATYNVDTKKIELVFPTNPLYKLEPAWTYTITLQIDATEQAYENYRVHGYTNKPDEGTGTHDDEEFGLYSNDNTKATVKYTYKGDTKTEKFDKPVILLDPGTLVIEKSFSGLSDVDLAALLKNEQFGFEVELSWPGDGEETKTRKVPIKGTDLKYDPTSKVFSVTIDGLSPKTTYEVSEKGAAVAGYDLTTTWKNEKGTIEKGGSATVSVTNTYDQKLSLTINKTISGDMAETDTPFDFTVKVNGQNYKGDSTKGSISNGQFSLIGGEGITLNDLKKNDKIEVKETGGAGYFTTITVEPGGTPNVHEGNQVEGNKIYATGNNQKDDGIQTNTVVTFDNNRDSKRVPLTGIFTDKLPYLLMFSIAMICTAGAMFNSSVRRRHGRDEE